MSMDSVKYHIKAIIEPLRSNAFMDTAASLLCAVLLLAGAMLLLRLSDFSQSETVEVTGEFEHTESSGGYAHARRLYRSGRALLFLKRDAIVYQINDGGGFGWQTAARKLTKGDRVTLLVGKDAYRRARSQQEKIETRLMRERNLDAVRDLVARQVIARKRNPVPIYEIRMGADLIFSKQRVLEEQRSDVVFWSAVAIATLAMLMALFMYDRRRRAHSVAA